MICLSRVLPYDGAYVAWEMIVTSVVDVDVILIAALEAQVRCWAIETLDSRSDDGLIAAVALQRRVIRDEVSDSLCFFWW